MQREDIECDIAKDGLEAEQAVRKGSYDLIIMGLVLPKVDGFEFLEKFNAMKKRGALKKVPKIVVLSNFSSNESKQRVIDLGVKEFMSKNETPLSDVIKYVKNMK